MTVFRPGHHAPNFRPDRQHLFVTMAVQGVLYGSVVPAPGVSLFDALIYLAAAYHAVQRTRLIRTGLLAAGATSFVGFAVLFAAAAAITPGLVVAPFVKPFIFVILSVYLLIPVGYALLLGGLAGVISKWVAPGPSQVMWKLRPTADPSGQNSTTLR